MDISTLLKHHITNNYYSYISAYWLKKANSIQKNMGIENYSNGLTPDVVRNNPEYKTCISKVDLAKTFARKEVPNAKELKVIHREYSKLYDMGQRIKINKQFGKVESQLLNNHQNIVSFEKYKELLSQMFLNFEV